jgi:hypothetical protein
MKIGVGVIGLGYAGGQHLDALKRQFIPSTTASQRSKGRSMESASSSSRLPSRARASPPSAWATPGCQPIVTP